MTITQVPSVGSTAMGLPAAPVKGGFSKSLDQVRSPGAAPAATGQVLATTPGLGPSTAGALPAPLRAPAVDAAKSRQVVRALEQINAAQHQMDQVMHLAQTGKTFSPAELLSLQAQVFRASQSIDLAGKVVEKATSGVKQVLQTQV